MCLQATEVTFLSEKSPQYIAGHRKSDSLPKTTTVLESQGRQNGTNPSRRSTSTTGSPPDDMCVGSERTRGRGHVLSIRRHWTHPQKREGKGRERRDSDRVLDDTSSARSPQTTHLLWVTRTNVNDYIQETQRPQNDLEPDFFLVYCFVSHLVIQDFDLCLRVCFKFRKDVLRKVLGVCEKQD